MKRGFITIWAGGICSQHSTLELAQKAIKKCEAKGGAKHQIAKILPKAYY